MSATDQKQLLKTFHRSLSDHPVPQNDPYYVPLYEQATSDPIQYIADNISYAESSSVSLLTGQRGTGKSTEILRLKSILEQEEDAAVFIVDISEYLNLSTPVDITDFFITLLAAFNEKVDERYEKNVAEEDYLTRITNFLDQEVKLGEAGVSVAGANIKASLKSDPSFKKLLQEKLKGYAARIIKESHDFAMEVVDTIRKLEQDRDKKVVLLIDSIEQIRGVGNQATEVYNSVENLFEQHAQALKLPHVHLLYTIPPYLMPLAPGLATVLGGSALYNLPSIHIRNKNDEHDPEGLALMQQIVTKRCAHWQQVMSEQQLNRLALVSGGDLRNFFRLLKQCIVIAGAKLGVPLPIKDDTVEQAENQAKSEIFLAQQDKEWLTKIHQSKQHHLADIQSLPQLARFLDSGLVLNYRNGESWYDVNPLIAEKLK